MNEQPLTLEELADQECLCYYCPIPEESQGVHCYGGEPVMCEGSHCDEAYDYYLEEWEEEHYNPKRKKYR